MVGPEDALVSVPGSAHIFIFPIDERRDERLAQVRAWAARKTPILRCATYARYSSNQQRDSSIVDQQRNMMRYAETKGWRILTDFMFSDEAISGAGLDRPGFQQLLRAAKASPRVIDVILVDDTSRISRSLADTVRLREDLNFTGIRFIAVSQGIDSDDEQADVMMTVHGLVDSLCIKELAKKTHRGLEGLALKGFHTGGNWMVLASFKSTKKRQRSYGAYSGCPLPDSH
jgi:DNA invertase Pin-like site-specific DNA recombinase